MNHHQLSMVDEILAHHTAADFELFSASMTYLWYITQIVVKA